MGSLPSTIKEPQVRALKTLMVNHNVKPHDLDQFWEEVVYWPSGYYWRTCGTMTSGYMFSFLPASARYSLGLSLPCSLFPSSLKSFISSLKNSSSRKLWLPITNTARIRLIFTLLTLWLILVMKMRVPLFQSSSHQAPRYPLVLLSKGPSNAHFRGALTACTSSSNMRATLAKSRLSWSVPSKFWKICQLWPLVLLIEWPNLNLFPQIFASVWERAHLYLLG